MTQPIIFENGSFHSKIGYGGNVDPEYVIPTVVADFQNKSSLHVLKINEEYNNYFIGEQGINKVKESKNYNLSYPIKNRFIDNWDLMEKFWNQSIYYYLKSDPQEHFFVLSEPPMNPPENREKIAEIFFETFNVPGLFIGMDSFFTIFGYHKFSKAIELKIDDDNKKALNNLTGIVIDSGEGNTSIVPICEGNIIASQIKSFPINGKIITNFIVEMIKERGEKINTEDLYHAAVDFKEKNCYLTKDIIEELAKFDKKRIIEGKLNQSSKFKKFEGIGKISLKPYSINVGYESFLGPELFFSPEIINRNYNSSLDEIVDLTIQQCPIIYRKMLYSNIIISGGSSLFRNFSHKLQYNITKRVDDRLKIYTISGKQHSIKVNVNPYIQKNLVWCGESYFSCRENFEGIVHTREEYNEKGPKCCSRLFWIDNQDVYLNPYY